MKTKVLVVDDHQMVRKGITTLLSDVVDIEVVGEASSGKEALSFLTDQYADVVLMDILMPEMNGIATTELISQQHPNVKVLAISMYDEYQYIQSIIQAGAKGYMLKDAEKDEIALAIRKLMENKNYYSDKVLSKITTKVVHEPGEEYTPKQDLKLTKREREVLSLVAKEYSNQEIADELQVSMRTVDTHKRNLLKKLKVKNVVGLVKYALKHQLDSLNN